MHDMLQWLTLLPIFMQDHCGGDSVLLGTVPPLPPPPGISVPTRDSSALYKSNNNSRKAQSLYGDRLALYKSNNCASPSMDTAQWRTSPTTTAEKLRQSLYGDSSALYKSNNNSRKAVSRNLHYMRVNKK